MMTKKNYLLISFLFFCLSFSFAQLSLPYSTDFEIPDQADWTQYRTGLEHSFDWGFSSASPYILHHDYPVGNMSADTVRDWMVSPLINFHSSSKLNIRAKIFTFIDVGSTDYLGVWFSDGSPDPADGDYVEIVDLTNFTPDDEWRDTTGIEIPYVADNGYIAIRYETIANWFVVSVDSLAIYPDLILSNQDANDFAEAVKLLPNPAIDAFAVEANILKQGMMQINLRDASGQLIKQIERTAVAAGIYQRRFSLSELTAGFYLVEIIFDDKQLTKKLIVTGK